MKIPQRISLVTQTVRFLKDNLAAGLWRGQLPGEHELRESLHVSRVTLRAALRELEREGWVRSSQGKRREIVPRRSTMRTAGDRVILLTESPLHRLHPLTIYWMDRLREHLQESDYRLEIHAGHAAFGAKPERILARMQQQFNSAGWVLYRSSEPMQRWFSKHALRCVIVGSPHPNVHLPSVDLDYRAICRHAVGQFLARKYQRLVFLHPKSGAAGDLESEEGFLEAAHSARNRDVQATVIHHDGTTQGICDKLDLLLKRPQRPSALLVSRPEFALTAVTHLLRRKLDLPRDLALISRDDDSFLESVTPSVARYSSDPTLFARKVSRLALEVVQGAALSRAEIRVMPSFIPGQTLG